VVQSATQTIAVIDGKPGPPCFAIGANRVVFTRSPKQFAYVAQLSADDKSVQVVTDVGTGPTYDAIDYPMFSPDGKHLAYRATGGKQQFVVLDGKPQTAVDKISTVRWFSARMEIDSATGSLRRGRAMQ
jgi:Tol biopolymer transport system component